MPPTRWSASDTLHTPALRFPCLLQVRPAAFRLQTLIKSVLESNVRLVNANAAAGMKNADRWPALFKAPG